MTYIHQLIFEKITETRKSFSLFEKMVFAHMTAQEKAQMFDYAQKYQHCHAEKDLPVIFASCWTHDVIEDTRQTYNDVKAATGNVQVAEITYALTNEKGRTRSDRANVKYYTGISYTPLAAFVKICDRLANVAYSEKQGGKMINKYRNEQGHFRRMLYQLRYTEMFDELKRLLK